MPSMLIIEEYWMIIVRFIENVPHTKKKDFDDFQTARNLKKRRPGRRLTNELMPKNAQESFPVVMDSRKRKEVF